VLILFLFGLDFCLIHSYIFPFGLEISHKWKWSNMICYLKYVLHFLTNFVWDFSKLMSGFVISCNVLPWLKGSFQSLYVDVVLA
jgi:hypothetical protein